MSNTYEDRMIAVAKAEDTYNLLDHIAWTDIIKPTLDREVRKYSEMLIQDALGIPGALGSLTREQIAGMCFGIQQLTRLLEKILKDGEKALSALQADGISLHHTQ